MILLLFEMVSGLEINLEKSSLFIVNGAQNLPRLGNVLGRQIGELPTAYLEMPLGARYKEKHVWKEIERDVKGDLLCGKDNTYLLGVEWCLSIVFWILYLHVLCPYFLYLSV